MIQIKIKTRIITQNELDFQDNVNWRYQYRENIFPDTTHLPKSIKNA